MKKHRAKFVEVAPIQYFGLSADESVRIHRLFSPLKVPKVLNEDEIKVCLFLHNNIYPGGNIENEKLDVLEEAIQLSPCATKSLKEKFKELLAAKKWAADEIGKARAVIPHLVKATKRMAREKRKKK